MFFLNNTTSKGVLSECAASITDTLLIKVCKTIILLLIMVTALLGNIFIIAVVYKKRKMRRTTNIFIANMAASDIFIAVVVIPRILVELYAQPYIWFIDGFFGSFLCKFCFFFADFSVCISIISHAVIALDRFWAIVYCLHRSPITPSKRKYIIALIWGYSFLLHSPNLYAYRLEKRNGNNYCIIDWSPLDSMTSKKTFFTIILIFVFAIPVFLMVVLYSWLVISLKTKQSLSIQTSQMRKQRRKEDILVLRKVVIMMTVFLLSITPLVVLGMLSYYIWDTLPCEAWSFAFIAFFMFLSNCGVNPCLCIALHKSYRLYIRKVLCASWREVSHKKSSAPPASLYEIVSTVPRKHSKVLYRSGLAESSSTQKQGKGAGNTFETFVKDSTY